MKKFLLAFVLLLCLSKTSQAQSVEFKVVKPRHIVRSSVVFVGQTTGKILKGVKAILTAPFDTPIERPEVKKFRYTFPKLKWERGKLEEVKPEEAESADNSHESKAKWRRKIRIEALELKKSSGTPEVLAPRPADTELLDLPRVRPMVTLT